MNKSSEKRPQSKSKPNFITGAKHDAEDDMACRIGSGLATNVDDDENHSADDMEGSEEEEEKGSSGSPSPVKLENKPGCVLIADNTHIDVAKKLEKYRKQEEALEKKLKKGADDEEKDEDGEIIVKK